MNQAKLYLDGLSYEEQSKLLLNLTRYAKRKAKWKSWRTGNHEELPGGETAPSIVSLAFEKVLTTDEKKRNWNPATEPDFYKYMLDVIDSTLYHLATGKDNKMFVNENNHKFAASVKRENVGVLEVAEERFAAFKDRKQFEKSEWLVRKQLSPEDELIAAEDKLIAAKEKEFNDKVLQAVKEAVADDKEVSAMIEAMENNFVKPREIAEFTGIDVDRIYNARKRLNTVVVDIKQQFDI